MHINYVVLVFSITRLLFDAIHYVCVCVLACMRVCVCVCVCVCVQCYSLILLRMYRCICSG